MVALDSCHLTCHRYNRGHREVLHLISQRSLVYEVKDTELSFRLLFRGLLYNKILKYVQYFSTNNKDCNLLQGGHVPAEPGRLHYSCRPAHSQPRGPLQVMIQLILSLVVLSR